MDDATGPEVMQDTGNRKQKWTKTERTERNVDAREKRNCYQTRATLSNYVELEVTTLFCTEIRVESTPCPTLPTPMAISLVFTQRRADCLGRVAYMMMNHRQLTFLGDCCWW